MGHTKCVQNVILVSQNAQFGSKWGLSIRTIRCKTWLSTLEIACVSLCLSEETLKAGGPFYLVSMPGEVKDPTQGVNV